MQHPFAGIIIPQSEPSWLEVGYEQHSSRRSLLRMLASAAAFFGFSSSANLRAAVADLTMRRREASNNSKARRQYQLYLVVSKGAHQLTRQRRGELDILGPYLTCRSSQHELNGKSGYLAWSAPDHVELLRAAQDIAIVAPFIGAAPVVGSPSNHLVVTLSPNSWRSRPDRDTYKSATELARTWSAALTQRVGRVRLHTDRTDRYVRIQITQGAHESLIRYLRRQPQVSSLNWERGPTTLALGEEGGVSTRALGEEGGVRPTTKALGEEGGGPTTMAVGEEGGKVTTMALGEEGAGRPRPQITTFALGEEGGAQ